MLTFLSRHAAPALLWASIFAASAAYAQQTPTAAWTLINTEDNIAVYSRPNPASPIDEVKSEATLEGNVDTALAKLLDLRTFKSDPSVRYVEELTIAGDSAAKYYYLISKMPFFMKDRDIVMRMHKSKTSQGYFLTYEGVDGIKPPVEGLRRMAGISSFISLQAGESPNTFRIAYKITVGQQDEEISGNDLAVKLANKSLPQSAYTRLAGLRKYLTSEEMAKK